MVRVVGVGHSFNDQNCAPGPGGDAISLMWYKKVLRIDPASASIGSYPTVTVQSGINLVLLIEALADAGYTLPNLPIVTSVTVGGALGTGAHGSGAAHGLLSGSLVAARLVTGDGSVLVVDERTGQNVDVLPALKVSLGALGVLSEVTLRVVPDFTLQVRELPMPLEECLNRLPELVSSFEYFKAWWVPHTGYVHAFLVDRVGDAMDDEQRGFGRRPHARSSSDDSVRRR